jgi:hypothetical protein
MPTYATPSTWWDQRELTRIVTGNTTANTDDGVIACDTTSGSITVTLPPATGVPGKSFEIKKVAAANSVTVAAVDIDGAATVVLTIDGATVTVRARTDGLGYYITAIHDVFEFSGATVGIGGAPIASVACAAYDAGTAAFKAPAVGNGNYAFMFDYTGSSSGSGLLIQDTQAMFSLRDKVDAVTVQLYTSGPSFLDGGDFMVGGTSPAATIHARQNSATGAKPCLELDQDDVDVEFVEFDGAEGADATSSISTRVGFGALGGWLQITVNGTKQWIAFYDDPTG